MPPGAFRQLAARIIKHGRQVFDGFIPAQIGPKTGAKAGDLRVNNAPKIINTNLKTRGTSWITKKYGLRPYLGPLAAEIRQRASNNFLGGTASVVCRGAVGARWYNTSGRLSLYALLGIGFVGLGSDEDADLERGYDNVCANIRAIFAGKQTEIHSRSHSKILKDRDFNLEDLEIGSLVAIGSNSAVYCARMEHYKDSSDGSDISIISESCDLDLVYSDPCDLDSEGEAESDSEDDFSIIGDEDTESDISILSHVTDTDNETNLFNGQYINTDEVIKAHSYPLAVKMLFNFHGTSKASEIYQQMEAELVPLSAEGGSTGMGRWEKGHLAKKKRLPPHPNIIDIHDSFVGEMPLLPEGLLHYPMALPERLNPDGCGRNKTLFLVMDRYKFTLEQYLRNNSLSVRESLLLLAQLTEAIAHLNSNAVAHRDLKTDNVMMDDTVAGCRLVLSDFGSCLADDAYGLFVPYTSRWMSKGGNPRLMAPEIASAEPGFDSWLDFRKSDLWAVGAIAYEIFGNGNPFYGMDSRTYEDSEVPEVDGAPRLVSRLVKAMVTKDPRNRPDASVVATAIQLLLWLPQHWLQQLSSDGVVPHKVALMRWLTTFSATLLCRKETANESIESQLQKTFLSRVHYREIKDACQLLSSLCDLS